MVKNFCQDGVAVSTQFGVNGPRFKSVSGTFQARDAADSAFAVVAGADPIADDDFVTKRWGQANLGGGEPGIAGNIYEDLQFYVDPADRNSYVGTGLVATDLEGNATSGTLSAAAVFENGAWTFGGEAVAGDDVRFTKDAVLDNIFATGGTIIAFVRPFGDGLSNLGRILDTTGSTTTAGYSFYATGETGGHVDIGFRRETDAAFGQWITDDVTDALGQTDPPLKNGSWACVSLSYDDTALTTDPVIRLNGTLLSVSEVFTPSGNAGTDAGKQVYVGNRSDGTITWDGQIGTILLFDRVLSAAEIQQVTGVFAPRDGIGFRGIDTAGGTDPISGQNVNIRAGDGSEGNNQSDGGDIILQAGNVEPGGAQKGEAGRVIIRSGDQNAGTSGSNQSNVLIESGRHFSGGGNVTVRVGLANAGASGGNLLLHAGDTTGGPGNTLIRGGGRGAGGLSGGITARGGDGDDFAGGGGNRAGGAALFRGGNAAGFSAAGGPVALQGGDATGNDPGGNVTIRSGTSVNELGGSVFITASEGGIFGRGGSITTVAGDTHENGPGGFISFETGSTDLGNFTDAGGGDFTITTGNNTQATSQPNAGGGSFIFTGGTSNADVSTSPGGEFIVVCGAGVRNAAGSIGGSVVLTAGDTTSTVAGGFGGDVGLTSGSSTGATGTPGDIILTLGSDVAGGGTTFGIARAIHAGTDEDPVFEVETTGTDGAASRTFVGTRDPNGLVTGDPGDTYRRVNATDSTIYVNNGGAPGNTVWANLGGGDSFGVAGAAGVIYEDLQFYMDAADRNSFDPDIGTPIDIIGNGTGGTLNADAVFADGAFLFDGALGNVNFAKSGDLNDIFGTSGPSDGGTIMAFVNPVSGGQSGSGRVVDTTDGLQEGYFLFLDNVATGVTGVQFARQFSTTIGQWDTSGRPVQRDGWNSVTVAYDDTDVLNDPTIYVQGVAVNSANTGVNPVGNAVTDAGNNLYFGNNADGNRTFNGQIAVVFMWNRILTDAEVAQAHNNFFARFARGASINGLLRRPGVNNVTSDELIADKGADSPTIAVTTFGGGNINLQSETTTSRGIFGASTSYAAILSGRNNIIRDNNDFCVVCGGVDNEIDTTGGSDGVIVGGSGHTLGDASNCIIGGGTGNTVKPGSGSMSNSGVFSGERNDVTGGSNSFIGGGEDNECGATGSSQTTDWSTIGGGDTNQIRGDYGFIGGGFSNNIGAVVSASAQYATIPGGRSNQIGGANVAGERGDYGFASGRQSRVLFDGGTVMSDGNATNADSIVAHEHFLKFSGGVRRLTTNGFNGEAWVKKNDHATTTTTTTHNDVIGTLAADQHTLTFEVTVASVEGTGRSSKGEKFLVQATRDTTVTVLSTSLGSVGVGNAVTDITYGFDVSGDDIRLNITDSVGNNYQHNWTVTKQEGGFAA